MLLRSSLADVMPWSTSIALVAALIATSAFTPRLYADDASPSSPLVASSLKLNAAGAQLALSAARDKAEHMQLKVNISVVDDGGHLIAFLRMDGARPGSIYTSQTKAASAALIRAETGPLPNPKAPNAHLSLAVENAAAASGGKFTTLKGGVPLVIEGQIVGAVGVGGATGEQDQEIARAGADALAAAVSGESTGDSP